MKNRNIVLIIFLISFSKQDDGDSKTAECNKDLVSSYGLHGLVEPLPIILEMCPAVRQSCCTKQDQLDMYGNWIHSKESTNVKHHYLEVMKVYGRLVETFTKTKLVARKIVDKLKIKKVANCKLIGQRLEYFKIDELTDKINQNLRKMEDFFYETYKGFYCAICNYENHKYIEEERTSILYSEKFCRDIVENTLPSVLLLHVHLAKYTNLVTKFVTSCDYKGDYQMDIPIETKYLFVADEKYVHELQGCRDQRNSEGWFIYCKPICKEFQIAKFAEFFEPDVQKLKNYTLFLEEKLGELNNGGKGRALFNNILKGESGSGTGGSAEPKKEGKTGRILSEHPKGRVLMDKDATNEAKDKSKKDLIFKAGLESKIQLESYQTDFGGADGISLYDEGRNSMYSNAMYNQIKTLIHLEKTQSSPSQTVDSNEADTPKTNAVGGWDSRILGLWIFVLIGMLI